MSGQLSGAGRPLAALAHTPDYSGAKDASDRKSLSTVADPRADFRAQAASEVWQQLRHAAVALILYVPRVGLKGLLGAARRAQGSLKVRNTGSWN